MFHNRIVQRLIAEFLAHLNHARNLVRLAFADQVCDCGGENEDFKRGHSAFLVNPLEEALRHNSLERFGKCCADFVLLFGRKHVDHAVHGFGGAGGVERPEHQMAYGRPYTDAVLTIEEALELATAITAAAAFAAEVTR